MRMNFAMRSVGLTADRRVSLAIAAIGEHL
jgi:hypothetical protein